jgi:predicted transcriptional regulator of viral defense system
MKYREILLEQLKSQPYFNRKAVHQLSEQYGLKSTTVDTYISKSLKRKEIITLKKGLYLSADFYNKNKGDFSYSFYLANILRTPSYVSSWAALQYYDLATEAIYIITSITPKVTRSYKTKVGNFAYQSIQKELFRGFSLVKGNFDFFIASPSKALFDLLYFKTRQFRGIRLESVKALIEELRIDIEEMSQEEQKSFFTMVKNYTHYE